MSNEVLGLVLLAMMFVAILGGFPISFTLIFLGFVFGWIGLGDRVFYLMTYQVIDVMMDTVLAAVAMFTFMGYVLESAGLMNRLFHAVQLAFGRIHGSLYLATIFTATLFAAATGIVGASVTIIALMAAPVMLRSGYDTRLSAGTICAGGTLGILIPPSVMLVVMGPVLSVSVARLYGGALLPGILLAVLYVGYTMGRVWLNPKLGPPLPEKELKAWERAHRVRLPEEYRQFLLVVGDGGDGPPVRGLWSLQMAELPDAVWARGPELRRRIKRPFPLAAAWPGPPEGFDCDDSASIDRIFEPLERGVLTLGEGPGCVQYWKLVVSGPAAGQIWLQEGMVSFEPRAHDFLAWYADWLEKRLAKSAAKRQRSSGSLPTSKQRAAGTKSVRRRPTARRRPTR